MFQWQCTFNEQSIKTFSGHRDNAACVYEVNGFTSAFSLVITINYENELVDDVQLNGLVCVIVYRTNNC